MSLARFLGVCYVGFWVALVRFIVEISSLFMGFSGLDVSSGVGMVSNLVVLNSPVCLEMGVSVCETLRFWASEATIVVSSVIRVSSVESLATSEKRVDNFLTSSSSISTLVSIIVFAFSVMDLDALIPE